MSTKLETCPCCGESTLIRTKKEDARSFAWCVNKDCQLNIPKTIFSKTLTRDQGEALITTGRTGIIDGFRSTKKPRRRFSSCLMVDKKYCRIRLDMERNELYR